MTNSYFNTNRLSGDDLRQAELDANAQEAAVVAVFKRLRKSLAPHEVWDASPELSKAPLTSVRRAMTSLTDRGVLIKTDRMVMGIYGKPVHLWRRRVG